MTEFSGISGVKGRSFPPPSVDKQLPLPEKGVYPSAQYMTCRNSCNKREGQGECDEIERRPVLDVAQAFTIGSRFGDIRRPGKCRRSGLPRTRDWAQAMRCSVVELVLSAFAVDTLSA
jgi:hypothetical protein